MDVCVRGVVRTSTARLWAFPFPPKLLKRSSGRKYGCTTLRTGQGMYRVAMRVLTTGTCVEADGRIDPELRVRAFSTLSISHGRMNAS